MKKITTVSQLTAALALSAACALPAMAQSTAPSDAAAANNNNGATTTVERRVDNDRDYGWIGLLGLAGLLGLRRKTEEPHRTNNLSQQR